MTVEFHKIGSDPEFLFARGADWVYAWQNAQNIIRADRAAAMRSWIGTDGHASTAEIRPLPSENVWLHLMNIAAALDKIGEVIGGLPQTVLIAQPYLNGENMGGHIHLGLWVEDGVSEYVLPLQILSGGRMVSTGMLPTEPGQARAFEKHLLAYMEAKTAFTADLFGRKMNYLLDVFDAAVQNSALRAERSFADDVRPSAGVVPSEKRRAAYVHLEYRRPCTWLAHPTLALAYLSLAKFTVLNWELISPAKPQPTGNPADAAKLFWERYGRLAKKDLTVTPDLLSLEPLLAKVIAERERWARPPVLVDIQAWRELLT